jgi:hypothetical protein
MASRRVALVAIFAATYAVLRLFPVSQLVGISSTLTVAEIFSPLVGMILGPFAGGASVLIGAFLVVAFGRPLVFDGLDFLPGVVGAVVAGFAIQGKVRSVAGLSLLLFAIYMLDPISAAFIDVAGIPVPFLWMHMLSTVAYVVVSFARRRGLKLATKDALVAASVFISTMSAHVAGSIMFENVLVRINGSMTPSTISGVWQVVFYLYPLERTFFTVAGTLLAIPVMRAIPRQTLEALAGGRAPKGT